jgi:hypothetical protein
MTQNPTLIYAAIPLSPTKVRDLFSSGAVRELLEKPGELRYAGWDLQTRDSARIVEGEYLEVKSGSRKVLDLHENGAFLVRADATESFLAWGTGEQNPKIRLNPLAISEFTYSFVYFYSRLLKHLEPTPTSISIRFQIENAKGERPLTLGPHGVGSYAFQLHSTENQHEAPAEKVQKDITVSNTDFEAQPERLAYQLVERLYLWFGLGTDKIPYTKEKEGVRMLDVDLIAAGGKKAKKS